MKKLELNKIKEIIKSYDTIYLSSTNLKKNSDRILNFVLKNESIFKEKIIIENNLISKKPESISYKLKEKNFLKKNYALKKIVTINNLIEEIENRNKNILIITFDVIESFKFANIKSKKGQNFNAEILSFQQNNVFLNSYNKQINAPIKLEIKNNHINITSFKVFIFSKNFSTDRLSKRLVHKNEGDKKIIEIDKKELLKFNKIQFVAIDNQNKNYFSAKYNLINKTNQFCEFNNLSKKETIVFNYNFAISKNNSNNLNNKFEYLGGQKSKVTIDSKSDEIKLGKIKINTGTKLITSSGREIILHKELGSGGEGVVYDCNIPQTVVKVLNNNTGSNLTKTKQAKIEFMVKNQINNNLIIWPKEAVYTKDESKKFIGFTMEKTRGISLYEVIHVENSPIYITKLNRIQILKMIITILKTIQFLHLRNIIIGDIKLENFMLDEKNISKVYFVDCDSYQIGKFPATKISKCFYGPEIEESGGRVSDKYRTFGNEYFAIFTLLFFILHKGKGPYVSRNMEEDERAKIRKGDFPYSLDETKTNIRAPIGYPVVNWSHLPSYVKQAFIDVGSNKGKNFGEKNRLTTKQWLEIFERYLIDLQNNKLSKDPGANIGVHDPKSKPISYSKVDIK